jgi:hypothetical protein
MPPVPVPDADLDSVETLSRVFWSVYVMQNIFDETTFRFGCMGTKRTKNSAIQRLGQCTSWEGHQRKDGVQKHNDAWRFIAMATFAADTQVDEILQYEDRIRDAFFGDGHGLVQVGRQDRFTSQDAEVVKHLFLQAIQQ